MRRLVWFGKNKDAPLSLFRVDAAVRTTIFTVHWWCLGKGVCIELWGSTSEGHTVSIAVGWFVRLLDRTEQNTSLRWFGCFSTRPLDSAPVVIHSDILRAIVLCAAYGPVSHNWLYTFYGR